MSENYFNQLEAELRDAVPRAARNRALRGSDRRLGGRWRVRGPLLALNAAAVIALTVVLIVVLGHGQSTPHPIAPAISHGGHAATGPTTDTYPPGANPTLAQLLANFAILRRSQTPADRSWKPRCGCAGSAVQLAGDTRLARTLPGGYRLFFDVQRFIAAGQDNLAASSYAMEYDLVSPNGNVFSESFGPNTQFTVYPNGGGNHLYVGIVPDGVATVDWRFSCSGGEQVCAGTHPFTVTTRVSGNAAVAQITNGACLNPGELTPAQRRNRARVRHLMTDCDRPTQVTWRNATGHVVATFPLGYGNLPAPPFITGARGARHLQILTPSGVGAARIGQPAATAIHALTGLLGSRTITRGRVPGCPQETETVWTSPAVASPLTIYARDGRFLGYQYGAPVSEIGLLRGPGAVLSTQRGLTVNDHVSQARRFYPITFHAHATSGGARDNGGSVWTISSDGGTLDGALLPVRYPMRTVPAANPIITITAGNTGCRQ